MRTLTPLLAAWALTASAAVAAPQETTTTDAVQALEQVIAIADGYTDVPDDPVLYGYAARLARLEDRKKVLDGTASMLQEAGAGDGRMKEFAERERKSASEAATAMDAIRKEAEARGVRLPEVSRVIHAIIIREAAGEARRLLEAHRSGSVADEQLISEALMLSLVLGDSHGEGMLRKDVLDRYAPEELRELP